MVVILQLEKHMPATSTAGVADLRMWSGVMEETGRYGSIGVYVMKSDIANLSALAFDRGLNGLACVRSRNPAGRWRIVIASWDLDVHVTIPFWMNPCQQLGLPTSTDGLSVKSESPVPLTTHRG